jgi:hypothetical protein
MKISYNMCSITYLCTDALQDAIICTIHYVLVYNIVVKDNTLLCLKGQYYE